MRDTAMQNVSGTNKEADRSEKEGYCALYSPSSDK